MSVEDTSAELHMGSSSGDLSLNLPRLEASEARDEVKELLFRMAADINNHLDNTGILVQYILI